MLGGGVGGGGEVGLVNTVFNGLLNSVPKSIFADVSKWGQIVFFTATTKGFHLKEIFCFALFWTEFRTSSR
jgi:hypothetical protein